MVFLHTRSSGTGVVKLYESVTFAFLCASIHAQHDVFDLSTFGEQFHKVILSDAESEGANENIGQVGFIASFRFTVVVVVVVVVIIIVVFTW